MFLVLSSDSGREVILRKHLVKDLCVLCDCVCKYVRVCVYEGFLW